jgi:hypothetical protein
MVDATRHSTPDDRPSVEALLRIYESERVENRQGLQILGALIAGILTYIIPVSGFVADGCNKAHTTLQIFNHGCAPQVPALVLYVIPLPAFALLGFLLTNQAVLETGGTYLKQLENMVEHAITPDASYEASVLRVPQHHRVIVPLAYGIPPFACAAIISHLVVGLGALIFVGIDIAILPWTTHETTSLAFCCLDGVTCGFLACCYMQIALWHRRKRPWAPSHLGDERA